MRFADRAAAGEELAGRVAARLDELLPAAEDRRLLQVLALPRGGVPVARPVADRLGRPLRLLLVRKLGVPGHPELAMGAIAAIRAPDQTAEQAADQAPDQTADQAADLEIGVVQNGDVLRTGRVRDAEWDRVLEAERRELLRRTGPFGPWTAQRPDGGAVVLIDDGLATGATMRAAVASVRQAGAGPVLVGIPVASRHAVADLERMGADVIALSQPEPMVAVGEAYDDFHQLTDDEVLQLLG